MTVIERFYIKHLRVKSDSAELSDKIHNEFIDKALCLDYNPFLLFIFTHSLLYFVLLLFENDLYLYVWFYASIAYGAVRFLITFCRKNNKLLPFCKKPLKLTQNSIALLGGMAGALWGFLAVAVLAWGNYPLESKILTIGYLFLYTFGFTSVYCMIPVWWISFMIVAYVPICIGSLFIGYLGIFFGLTLSVYVGFILAITYRNYKVFFRAVYLQYQNKEYVENIDKYSRKLEKLNQSLEKNNNELRGEIRKRKLAEQKIRKLASTDSLTGVTNRVSLNEKMNRVLRYARRARTNVGVMFVDFDQFKLINDNFGHHVGDELLRSVVRRLNGCVRETDEIFRIGGDEFIILLTNIEHEESLMLVAQNILYVLEQPHLIEEKSIISRVSMGISIYPKDADNSENLLKFADAAMYKSKEAGGNRYTFY